MVNRWAAWYELAGHAPTASPRPRSGVRVGGSDPRSDGAVIGYWRAGAAYHRGTSGNCSPRTRAISRRLPMCSACPLPFTRHAMTQSACRHCARGHASLHALPDRGGLRGVLPPAQRRTQGGHHDLTKNASQIPRQSGQAAARASRPITRVMAVASGAPTRSANQPSQTNPIGPVPIQTESTPRCPRVPYPEAAFTSSS